jgi:hypothetical protein
VHAARLQFKRLCRRIDRQYKQNMQKLDNNTDGLCPVDIFSRVAKQLQLFATITDGLCPIDILSRVAKKLQPLPQSPTDFPTTSLTDGAHSKACGC